ncbi:hypothetical protein Aperf_G00000076129 [Anoplocephala perfoliata]
MAEVIALSHEDPNEKNQTPPETNENEFCVMMTSDASKEIETSIKKIFGRCDWLKMVEACPVPNQVRQALKTNTSPSNGNSEAKRKLCPPSYVHPPKRTFSAYSKPASEGGSSAESSCRAAPRSGGNRINGIHLFNEQGLPPNSTINPISDKAPTIRLHQEGGKLAKQKVSIPENNLKQMQQIKPHPSPQNLLRSSLSETLIDPRRPSYAIIQTPNILTIDLTAVTGQSRLQNPASGPPALFPLHTGISSLTYFSDPALQPQNHQQNRQQKQQQPLFPSYYSQNSFGTTLNTAKRPSSAMTDSNDVPLDLSNQIPSTLKTPQTRNESNNSSSEPMDYLEGDVINLVKPKGIRSMDAHQEDQPMRGSRCWKCELCDISFDTEWFLHEHYGGKAHVCKSLESVDDSESLQKRIRSREVCSEALVNRTTGRLLLQVVNKLIKTNSQCNLKELPS